MSTRLFHLMDSNKTEIGHPYLHDRSLFAPSAALRPPERDVRMAMGWSPCRDGCEGRPAHVWLPGMRDETECMFAAAGIVTHGCIANIDMAENKIPDATLKKAFHLCERISPAFSRVKPLRWAAVHFSWIDPHATKRTRITEKLAAIQAIKDTTVILNLPGAHKTLYDAVTGQPLAARSTERGLEVKLPPFAILTVVVANTPLKTAWSRMVHGRQSTFNRLSTR